MKSINSVFRGYLPWWPRNWGHNIKAFFRNIKYGYQRAIRGYCDRDLWCLDYYYTILFRDSLRDFAKNIHGWPLSDEFPTIESWQEYLYSIANNFDRSREDGDFYKNPYEEEFTKISAYNRKKETELNKIDSVWKKYIEEEKKIYEWRREQYCRGMDALKESFEKLWD